MIPEIGAALMNRVLLVVSAVLLGGPQLQAQAQVQQADTGRAAVRIDSTRSEGARADSLRADSARKSLVTSTADGETEAAAVANRSLKDVGKVDAPLRLSADLSERELHVIAGNGAIRTFKVAVGTKAYPTPTGTFRIRKIVWNPSWIPPDSKWAKGKTAKGPGEKGNPMKVAKIFFKEPDYYIHGTGDVASLGSADSHGCLRMSPDEIAELAQFLMENGGQAREEGWFSRILHMRWKTTTVTLSQPILMTVKP